GDGACLYDGQCHPFLRLRGGTHPLAVGPGNPGLLHRPGRSDRQRRWVPGAGPGRQIDLKTTRTASADSEVRPGPRPQTLRPYQAKTSEAGPEAQSTSSLPNTHFTIYGCSLHPLRTYQSVLARLPVSPPPNPDAS